MKLSKFTWVEFNNQTIDLDQTAIFKIHIQEINLAVDGVKDRVLSQSEKLKFTRFKFLADKQLFSTARVVLKLLLEKISGVSPFSLDFGFSANGKPFFGDIEFNLAHSGNFVLIALSNKPVGVDVEILKEGFDFDEILCPTFSIEEIRYINQNGNRKENFLTLWTRKEALLKATGEGLTDDLASISVLDNNIKRIGLNYTLTSFKINHCDIASVAHSNTCERINAYQVNSNFINSYL